MTILVDRIGAFTPFPLHRPSAHTFTTKRAYCICATAWIVSSCRLRFPEHFEWNIYEDNTLQFASPHCTFPRIDFYLYS